MIIEEKEFLLKNGKNVTIGSPKYEDAEELAIHYRKVAQETLFLINDLEDGEKTVEDELTYIKKMEDSPNSFSVAAKIGEKVVGLANISGRGKFRVKHRCEIGISIQKAYWGLGIGTILMQVLVEQAKRMGLEQMELAVHDGNTSAINLYKKFGFLDAGWMPNCFKYKDGSYAGLFRMYKDLKGEENE